MTTPDVRHFRAIFLWPLQLTPQGGRPPRQQWEVMEELAAAHGWEAAPRGDADGGRARHYSEFVTFLPYVQRFLYGESIRPGREPEGGASPVHAYRRRDVTAARLMLERGAPPEVVQVERVELYFFADMDIAVLVTEIHGDDMPLARAQDLLFRFGRAFPAFWNADGRGGHCLERVEWLSADGAVLAASDFEQRERYLSAVSTERVAHIASHWQYLLTPMVTHRPGAEGALRYRQIEYYRMPWMCYLSFDDPAALSRAAFARLAVGAAPSAADTLPFSAKTLADFESRYCYDRYWAPGEPGVVTSTRYLCSGHAFTMVGSHRDGFFTDPDGGLLGQFRHQYFLLGLLSHFHRAALLMLSDRLVVAIGRLDARSLESVKRFKREIRRTMETFLRFTHRYWFHEVSTQDQARELFSMWTRHLATEQLFSEVREEVEDMNSYLDSDSLRRQAGTVVRLTVVTALGLVGTLATGILGMNVFDYTDAPPVLKLFYFLLVLVPSVLVVLYAIRRSKPLADYLEMLSDKR